MSFKPSPKAVRGAVSFALNRTVSRAVINPVSEFIDYLVARRVFWPAYREFSRSISDSVTLTILNGSVHPNLQRFLAEVRQSPQHPNVDRLVIEDPRI